MMKNEHRVSFVRAASVLRPFPTVARVPAIEDRVIRNWYALRRYCSPPFDDNRRRVFRRDSEITIVNDKFSTNVCRARAATTRRKTGRKRVPGFDRERRHDDTRFRKNTVAVIITLDAKL